MKTLLISLRIFLFFTILTGIIYPLLVTGIAQSVFPAKANGSIIRAGTKETGSILIGQQFDSAGYFSSRPSAVAYNPLPSGGSNYGLTSEKLRILVAERKRAFIAMNHLDNLAAVPAEMLFSSASGLDPHISPLAALMQADRVSEARQFNGAQRQKLLQCIGQLTEHRQYLCFGEERINVLLLNLEIDKIR
ncbi:MAG: potassium-transporting ATPase subunit KdpC [Bacteroidota bacterium]